MPNELLEELREFMGSVRRNPPEEKMYEFLQELSSDGKLFDYSEEDWVEAGRAYQMSDDEVAQWIETAASWLQDTTEEGTQDPEPSFWAQESQRLRTNPSTDVCHCEETCTCGDDCPCDLCKPCGLCKCCCVCEEDVDGEEDDGGGEDEDYGEEE